MEDILSPETAEAFYRFQEDEVGKVVISYLKKLQENSIQQLINSEEPEVYRAQGKVVAYANIFDLFRHAERIFKAHFGERKEV